VYGRDACDEEASRLADDMEWKVLAVAAGNLREHVQPGITPRFGFTLRAVDESGGTGGDLNVERLSDARRAEVQARLLGVPSGWAAWEPRGLA